MNATNGISEGRHIRKIPGGKMLKVVVRVENGKITYVRFHGDYFVYPEEAVEDMEREIYGKNLEEAKEIIEKYLSSADMVGISVKDFCEALEEAYKKAR